MIVWFASRLAFVSVIEYKIKIVVEVVFENSQFKNEGRAGNINSYKGATRYMAIAVLV